MFDGTPNTSEDLDRLLLGKFDVTCAEAARDMARRLQAVFQLPEGGALELAESGPLQRVDAR